MSRHGLATRDYEYHRSSPDGVIHALKIVLFGYRWSSVDPFFTVAPLLYAVSDLLQDGYRDIIIYTFSANIDDGFSEADLLSSFQISLSAKDMQCCTGSDGITLTGITKIDGIW